MKTFNIITIALLLGLVLLVGTQRSEAQSRRGSSRSRQNNAVADEEANIDEAQPVAPARRRQASRKFSNDDEDDSAVSPAASSSGSDNGIDQSDAGGSDYYPSSSRRSGNGGGRRTRYEQDEEVRPARRRNTARRNNRRNSSNNGNNGNNNLNFNGLPDGFPSAAFGAGFGAAVSSGGRGKGPSNAAGFGAGFAQSSGGNALAGGFGSGLVGNGGNYGGGNNRNYDDDDADSDYDSGRAKSKQTTKCMMLQLVQSPSLRTQRLIKELCNEDKVKSVESPGQDSNLNRATSSSSRPYNKQNKKNIGDDEDEDKLTETKSDTSFAQKNKKEASNDQGTSESRVDEINSFVGSYSSTSDRRPTSVTKVSKVVDKGNSFAIASSSLSSFPSFRNRNENDENDDNYEEDDVREDGRNDRVIDGNEDYESQ